MENNISQKSVGFMFFVYDFIQNYFFYKLSIRLSKID